MEPRLEALGVPQGAKFAPGGQQRRLDGVVSKVEVAQDPERDRHASVAGQARQGIEGLSIALLRLLDQLCVHPSLRAEVLVAPDLSVIGLESRRGSLSVQSMAVATEPRPDASECRRQMAGFPAAYGLADALGLASGLALGSMRVSVVPPKGIHSPRCSVISELVVLLVIDEREAAAAQDVAHRKVSPFHVDPSPVDRARWRHSQTQVARSVRVRCPRSRSRTTTRNRRPGGCSTRRRHSRSRRRSARRHRRDRPWRTRSRRGRSPRVGARAGRADVRVVSRRALQDRRRMPANASVKGERDERMWSLPIRTMKVLRLGTVTQPGDNE